MRSQSHSTSLFSTWKAQTTKKLTLELSSDVLIWILTNTFVMIILSPCSPKHCSTKLPWLHLVCCCVILLGFFKNGDKLKILRVFPSPPPLGRKGKREWRPEESKNRERYEWSAHETWNILLQSFKGTFSMLCGYRPCATASMLIKSYWHAAYTAYVLISKDVWIELVNACLWVEICSLTSKTGHS